MILLAKREIYRLDIKVGVTGDGEAKSKLSATEKMAEQAKRKIQALGKVRAVPSARFKDNASSTIDKINSKAKGLNRAVISPTAKLNDQATSKLNKISKTIRELDKANITANLKINDQTSTYLNKVHAKNDKFKNTNINPTAKALDKNGFKSASMSTFVKLNDQASDKLEKIKSTGDKLNNKKTTVNVKAKDEASSVISKIENKINGWVKAGAKKVISLGIAGTMALGGIGVGASLKTYSEYEKGLSNVKAVTGANVKEMHQLDAAAKKYGAKTAWSARHVTQAEELLGQAGFSVGETISALPGLLDLASAGDLDLAAATDIASGTLRAFNISADKTGHVSDVLALSASATNSDVADLGETMKYCAPVSQALGISLEDTAAAAGLLSNANIKGSQAGTVLRAAFARLASPTKESLGLMKKYGINAFDAQGKMKPLSAVVDNLNGSLKKLTSQQRADVISNIFGVEAMSGVLALMNQGGQSVSDLSSKLKESNGAAKDMAETKLDNLNGQWIRLKAAVEHMQITLGEKLAPYAKQFVDWLIGKMPAITDSVVNFIDYLSNNTSTIKSLAGTVLGLGVAFSTLSAIGGIGNTIVGVKSLLGAFKGAAVVGETAAIAGGLKEIGILGSILPAIFNPVGLSIAASLAVAGIAATSNANLMKKSLATTTEELGPVEKMMNKLNRSIYKSKAELQEAGLAYEDFGNNIGEEFKNKVKESTKAIRDFQFYINKINLDGKIDQSESNEFNNKVNEMCQSAIKTIEESKIKAQDGMKDMFADDGKLSEAEQATLSYISKSYDTQITAEQKLRDDIYDIKNKAVQEHGKLYDSEIKQIKEKQAEMARIELEAAGGTKDELLYAKNKFKARAQGLDIKDGSALAQEAAKDRDTKIVDVKAKYDTYIDKLKNEFDKATDATDKNNLKAAIEESEKSRSEKLKEINKLWDDNLEALYKSNSNLKGKINKYNGKELTGDDKNSQNTLEKMKSNYKDLNNVTQDGFYGLKNSVTGAMSSIYVTVDKTTGEIVGAWNYTTGQCGGYTSEMSQKVKELGTAHQETSGAAIQSLIRMGASVDITSGQVKGSLGNVIGSLSNVTIAADKTRTGILNIGDKHIEITSNVDGQIINMQYLKGSVDNIPSTADVMIRDNANTATANINGTTNAVNNMPSSKTITITTIFKKIIQTIEDVLPKDVITKKTGELASGTNFSKEGFSTVDERGWELSENKPVPILGGYNSNPLTYMSSGTKILNHMQSVQDMRKEVSKQVNEKIPKQPQQIQYQLIKPQQKVQVAGVGGTSFGDINVKVDGNQDINAIVEEATQEFGRKLKEAFTNIRR